MTRIFIPTKNRAETISTHRYFKEYDYRVLVHNPEQYKLYERHSEATELDMRKVICTMQADDQFGLTRQREFACQYYLDECDGLPKWFLFADDNIKDIQAVSEPLYQNFILPVDEDPSLRTAFNTHCEPIRFMDTIIPECIAKAEELGARHLGFATVDNFFFRGKKWKEIGYIIGKMMLWHNTGELEFDHTITMEDYELTAQSLLKFGVAPVNNYVYPVAKHYQPGGMGTMNERLPARTADVIKLLEKYPGLLRNKKADGLNPDLALRLHNRSAVEIWRKQMKIMKEGWSA